jgi:hypothetical protein
VFLLPAPLPVNSVLLTSFGTTNISFLLKALGFARFPPFSAVFRRFLP